MRTPEIGRRCWISGAGWCGKWQAGCRHVQNENVLQFSDYFKVCTRAETLKGVRSVSPRHFPPPRRCSSFFRSVPTHPHTLSCDVSPCFPLCACCATVQRCYRLPFRPFTHPRATDRHTPPHTLPLSSTSTSFVPIPPPFVRSVIPIVRVIFSAPQSRHSRLTRPASLP